MKTKFTKEDWDKWVKRHIVDEDPYTAPTPGLEDNEDRSPVGCAIVIALTFIVYCLATYYLFFRTTV